MCVGNEGRSRISLSFTRSRTPQGKSQLQGNVSLLDCTITKEDFSFSVRAPHSKVYSFLVQTQQDVDSWAASAVAAIKQAREESTSKPNNVDIVNSVRTSIDDGGDG